MAGVPAELQEQFGALQARADRADALEYALAQVQQRAAGADDYIAKLQGAAVPAAAQARRAAAALQAQPMRETQTSSRAGELTAAQRALDEERTLRQQAQDSLARLHNESFSSSSSSAERLAVCCRGWRVQP